MKLFQVVYEEDGATTREPGRVATEIRRCEMYYVADTLEQVWEEIEWLRRDHEREVVTVTQVLSAVSVLKPLPNPEAD